MSTVAVVIVSFRSEAAAAAAARAVASEPEVAAITIVDNSAQEHRTEDFPLDGLEDRVTILRPSRNLGYAAGNNTGIRAAIQGGHDFVLVLNPDVDLVPGTVRKLIGALGESAAQIVSPALSETSSEGREVVLLSPGFDLFLGRGSLEAQDTPRFTRTFFGAAFLARSRCFEQYGLLAEELFLYCEEVEFVERLQRLGQRRVFHVAEDVVVRHGRGTTVSPNGYEEGSRSAVAYEEAARSVVLFGRRYHPVRVGVWICARLAMAVLLAFRNPTGSRAVLRGVARGLLAAPPSPPSR